MLRYYEEQELLSPSRHPNGYRDYTDHHVEQVTTIRDLNRAGVPIRFIKIVLDRQTGKTGWTQACDDILAGLVHDQIADLDSKITSVASSRTALTQFLHDTRSVTPSAAQRGVTASPRDDDSRGTPCPA